MSPAPSPRQSSTTYVFVFNCWFSLTWSTAMIFNENKRKRLHNNRVKFPEDLVGAPTWPPFLCFGHQHGGRDVMWKPRIVRPDCVQSIPFTSWVQWIHRYFFDHSPWGLSMANKRHTQRHSRTDIFNYFLKNLNWLEASHPSSRAFLLLARFWRSCGIINTKVSCKCRNKLHLPLRTVVLVFSVQSEGKVCPF